jgi:hypothetical protein
MPAVDLRIREVLEGYDEPVGGNVWFVQGQAVLYHKTCERIAAKAGITFQEPTILRAERDEAVILVRGMLGDRWDWDIGEALVNVNYRISGRQAAYVYAMALKRARDRLILKLIGLHGLLYSESELDPGGAGGQQGAQEGQQEATDTPGYGDPPASDEPAQDLPEEPEAVPPVEARRDPQFHHPLMDMIDKCKTINSTTDFMLAEDTRLTLSKLPNWQREKIRSHGKAHLMALGWPRKAAQA